MGPIKLPDSITSLSDQVLVEKLQSYGKSVGPILPTTRRVYQIALYKLETEQPSTDPDDAAQEDDEEEVIEEPPAPQQPPLVRQRFTPQIDKDGHSDLSRTEAWKPTPRRPLHPERGDYTPSSRPEYSKPQAFRKAPVSKSPSSAKGGLPLWVKLLTVLLLAGFCYLVYKNMESEPLSNIPKYIDSEK